MFFFFFQAEDGIRDVRTWLEFRRVLFRSKESVNSRDIMSQFPSVHREDQKACRHRSRNTYMSQFISAANKMPASWTRCGQWWALYRRAYRHKNKKCLSVLSGSILKICVNFKDTKMRKAISPELRLIPTLHYFLLDRISSPSMLTLALANQLRPQ